MDVKRIRKRLGLTQERFAHALGMTAASINRWERGRSNPSPLAMRRIEDFWREELRTRKRKARKKTSPVP
jgi:putative transcriptional regulator